MREARVWRSVWARVIHSDGITSTKSYTLWSFHTVENKRNVLNKNPQMLAVYLPILFIFNFTLSSCLCSSLLSWSRCFSLAMRADV